MRSDYDYMNNSTTPSKNRLSDRDILLDVLITEKNISHMYNHAILESSNSRIINTFDELQQDEYQNANLVFNAMQSRGWYNPTSNQQSNSNLSNPMQQKSGIKERRVARQAIANSTYAVRSGASNFGGKLSNKEL